MGGGGWNGMNGRALTQLNMICLIQPNAEGEDIAKLQRCIEIRWTSDWQLPNIGHGIHLYISFLDIVREKHIDG